MDETQARTQAVTQAGLLITRCKYRISKYKQKAAKADNIAERIHFEGLLEKAERDLRVARRDVFENEDKFFDKIMKQ